MATKRRSSKVIWVLLVLAVLILAGGAAAFFLTPGVSQPRMGEGDIILCVEADGSLRMTWQAPDAPAVSRVSLRVGEEGEYRLLDEYSGNTAVLDSSFLRAPFSIQIQGAVKGKNLLGMEREKLSQNSIEVTVEPINALETALAGEAGRTAGELRLTWNGSGVYELCTLENQVCSPICQVSGGTTTLRFGEGGDLDLPSYDEPWQITLREVCRGEGYVLYGPTVPPLAVRREILLGNTLSVECQEVDERIYALRWNETKGEYYEVQEWVAARSSWDTLARVERTDPLRYETGMLRSGSDHRYRVVAVGGEEDGKTIAPAEVTMRAEISTRYATVWPVVEVAFCEDAALTKPVGKIPAGTALCVLEEGKDCFQVRYREQYGYVDSRFCMINLLEYVGDVCAYDITNSYSSIFKVHEYPVQNVTGQVVQGFEGVSTAEDGFLVPYLYPCAKKLLTAAQAAEADGYRLRIYEAFRPNEATRYLYDTTLSQLDYPVPTIDEETGEYVFYEPPEEPVDPETGLPLETGGDPADSEMPVEGDEPAPADSQEPSLPGGETEPGLPETETGLQLEGQTEPESGEILSEGPTYRQIMTDGRFGINSFLAAVVSAHNRGIALDLTIERLDGTPLEMQSSMHDLSWYSATYLNNENAKLLESYMTMPGVAMVGLTSEWWHFQDNETRESIGLTSYLYRGVTAEGWTRDNIGWRYRAADGSYARSTTIRVDGQRYTLDEDGYVIE